MKKILFIAAAAMALYACSKEKKLENRLDNRDWNIDTYMFELVNNGVSDPGQAFTVENGGNFKLDKGGKGTILVKDPGGDRNLTIDSWTTGIDTVRMDLTDIATKNKEKWVIAIKKNEKKTQEWSRIVKQGTFEFRYTYKLSRKK
jgi:hypothetical protein